MALITSSLRDYAKALRGSNRPIEALLFSLAISCSSAGRDDESGRSTSSGSDTPPAQTISTSGPISSSTTETGSESGPSSTSNAALVTCRGGSYSPDAVYDSGTFGSTLDGDDALAQLRDVECIAGAGLTILGVSTLEPLSRLSDVESLAITESPQLDDLAPLAGIARIEHLSLLRLNGLDTIESLGGLHTLQDSLLIDECETLQRLSISPANVSLRSVQIFRAPALTDIGSWSGSVETAELMVLPQLPHDFAVAWAKGVNAQLTTCGLLEDPSPDCGVPPPPS